MTASIAGPSPTPLGSRTSRSWASRPSSTCAWATRHGKGRRPRPPPTELSIPTCPWMALRGQRTNRSPRRWRSLTACRPRSSSTASMGVTGRARSSPAIVSGTTGGRAHRHCRKPSTTASRGSPGECGSILRSSAKHPRGARQVCLPYRADSKVFRCFQWNGGTASPNRALAYDPLLATDAIITAVSRRGDVLETHFAAGTRYGLEQGCPGRIIKRVLIFEHVVEPDFTGEGDCRLGRAQTDKRLERQDGQGGHQAGDGSCHVRYHHGITAGLGGLHVGQQQHVVSGPGQVRSVKRPLVNERGGAGGCHLEARLVAEDDHLVGRFCGDGRGHQHGQSGSGAGDTACQVADCHSIAARLGRLHGGQQKRGGGGPRKRSVVECPLVT